MYSAIHYILLPFLFLSINISVRADVNNLEANETASCHVKSIQESLYNKNYHQVPLKTMVRLTSCSLSGSNIMKYWYTLDDLCGTEGDVSKYFAFVKSDGSRQCKSNPWVTEQDCSEKFDFTYDSMTIRNISMFTPREYICLCGPEPNAMPLNTVDSLIVHSIKLSATKDLNADVISEYSGALTSLSSTFQRPGGSTGRYYYSAIRFSVTVSGSYACGSFSAIDLYGYLYEGNFNPSNPYSNLLLQDDDSLGSDQFALGGYLSSGRTYTLVVTTHLSGVRGSFEIGVVGPSSINIGSVVSAATATHAFTLNIMAMAMISTWKVFN